MNHPNPRPIKYRFFAYDPYLDGIEFFETADEARASAESTLEGYRDDAPSDGWPEDTEAVKWGIALGQAQKIIVDPPAHVCDENGNIVSGDFDEYWDFAIVEPAPTLAQIEAFPDMLAALEYAASFIRNGIEFGYIERPIAPSEKNTLPMIEAAIAKAKGGVE